LCRAPFEAFGYIVRDGDGGALKLISQTAFAFERFIFGYLKYPDSEFDGAFPNRQIFKTFVFHF
jgi:hypothetical protein